MTWRTESRSLSVARTIALLVSGAVALDLAGACMELKGSIGSDCIKDQDCQSGICSQGTCVTSPTLLDAQGGTSDAGGDATLDATSTPPNDASSEATGDAPAVAEDAEQPDAPGTEADSSVPLDAPAETGDTHPDATFDAPVDGPTDASSDGRGDAGEAG